MTAVHIHPEAAGDILRIVDELSDYSHSAAVAFIKQYESVIDDLARFPDLGVESRSSPGSRVLIRRGYLYWYERREENVILYSIEAGPLRAEPL